MEENSKVATTPTKKFREGDCSKCSHYWLKDNMEICTNPDHFSLYGKKKPIGTLSLCNAYDPLDYL